MLRQCALDRTVSIGRLTQSHRDVLYGVVDVIDIEGYDSTKGRFIASALRQICLNQQLKGD